MRQMKHWQDPVNGLLGLWLIASPWILGMQEHGVAMANFIVVGLLLLATALGAMLLPRAWEEWTGAVLGIYLMASPWILGFANVTLAMQVAVFTGLAAVVLALWVLTTDKDFSSWLHPTAG